MVNTNMNDVAKEAGVSQSTVSAVLNNNQKIKLSAETKAKVLEAVKKLGYRPNTAAKALKTKTSYTIGIISENVATSPFAGDIIKGAQDEARQNDRTLVVMDSGGDSGDTISALEFMLDKQVEGIVFASMYSREVDLPKLFQSIPTVMVNCFCPDSSYPSVIPDDHWGGYFVTKTFVEKKHRRIALINGGKSFFASKERLKGYQKAIEEGGLKYDPGLISYGSWWPENGYESIFRLMDLSDPPTAVFCGNDRIAIGAMMAVKELGLHMPNDIALIGYDGQEIVSHLTPSLTTFTLPHYQMGVWGVETLMKLNRPLTATTSITQLKGNLLQGASS